MTNLQDVFDNESSRSFRRHTDETRAKISAASKLKQNDPELKATRRLSQLGEKNSFYGKKHTEETRKIISKKRGTKATRELKPCYAISPEGQRFDFNSITECCQTLNYPGLIGYSCRYLLQDGTPWKVKLGKFKDWTFARIIT